MTDDELLAILEDRMARDSGMRWSLEEVMQRCGLTLDDLGPDEPKRVWLLGPGQWLTNRCTTNPDGTVRDFLPASPVFLGGDEFGNRPICVRLPGHRLLCLNWTPRLRDELEEGP